MEMCFDFLCRVLEAVIDLRSLKVMRAYLQERMHFGSSAPSFMTGSGSWGLVFCCLMNVFPSVSWCVILLSTLSCFVEINEMLIRDSPLEMQLALTPLRQFWAAELAMIAKWPAKDGLRLFLTRTIGGMELGHLDHVLNNVSWIIVHKMDARFPNGICPSAAIHDVGTESRGWKSVMNLYALGAGQPRFSTPFAIWWQTGRRRAWRSTESSCGSLGSVTGRASSMFHYARSAIQARDLSSFSFSLVTEEVSRERRYQCQSEVEANASCGMWPIGCGEDLTSPPKCSGVRASHIIRRVVARLDFPHPSCDQQCGQSHASPIIWGWRPVLLAEL